MTNRLPLSFPRLAASLRLCAVAVVLACASAQSVAAAPLTLGYSFIPGDPTIAKFNTTLGTLLGIDLSFHARLSADNPFVHDSSIRSDSCSAVFSGGSVSVSAPGTSTLLTLDGTGSPTGFCGMHEFGVFRQKTVSLDPSLFGTFSSAGLTLMDMIVTLVGGAVTFTHGINDQTTLAAWDGRLSSGGITYTYCPIGEDCSTPPPPVPSVPEPATVVMLTTGLAGILARRRAGRP
jgi:hypothetical protein